MASAHADAVRQVILDNFDMSLGTGLGPLQGKLFRIGHLGELNELALGGALGGVEMGLRLAGVPFRAGGVTAALESLADMEADELVVLSDDRLLVTDLGRLVIRNIAMRFDAYQKTGSEQRYSKTI